MGNCIGAETIPCRKMLTFQSLDGGKEDFEDSETDERIGSGSCEVVNFPSPGKGLVTDAKLISEEVCCLIPQQVVHCGPRPSRRVAGNRYRGRRVKIVVTKQQFEQLVRSMKVLQHNRIAAIQSFRTREQRQKWRPSLDTIPEL